jgi:hypothetical protein
VTLVVTRGQPGRRTPHPGGRGAADLLAVQHREMELG